MTAGDGAAASAAAVAGHLDRARAYLRGASVDALLIVRPENRRHVTGFTGSAGLVLITHDAALLAVDFRYYEQAATEAPAFRVIRGGTDPAGALADGLKAAPSSGADPRPGRIGFESEFLPYAQTERLRERFAPAQLVPLPDVDRIRWVKDEVEIATVARAAEIADAGFVRLLEVLRPGLTEREAALELEIAVRRAGGERLAFDTVLASGPRGALPHGRATDRVMERGEFVTVDFGAVYDGYVSDCTRTVALGAAGARQREVYDAVLAAQLRALEAVRPGVACRDVDAAGRAVIAAAGFGEAFGHAMGHGIGLDVHEGPPVSPRSDAVLEPGMIVTIEPGVYVPGWGGVRIEDAVVVTEAGARVLGRLPKDLLVVGGV
ncbi:MAG TPA: Xaa-Pro peptidase family protein [bacterium]|nr:Xaa-Pro peptidase family protein [bacterium]